MSTSNAARVAGPGRYICYACGFSPEHSENAEKFIANSPIVIRLLFAIQFLL